MEAKEKVRDPELIAYRHQVGTKEYKREYYALRNKVLQSPHLNQHKQKSTRTRADLEKIKEKYRNGVPQEVINQMVGL